MFSYTTERSTGPGIDLSYHLAPWDRPILQGESAVISGVRLTDATTAEPTFAEFRAWCARHRVLLVNCRLDHERIAECGFLEARGFRFVELNYRPVLRDLSGFTPDPGLAIRDATPDDEAEIVAMASQIFDAGRLHADPEVGREIGDRRYAAWAANAFQNSEQQVLVCLQGNRIAAFMVTEAPSPTARFWSLVGLAPGLRGQGLGRRIWRTVLAGLAAEGVTEVSTSISSHNTAAHNLYVSLGFRFPVPAITLHWCPLGPLRAAA